MTLSYFLVESHARIETHAWIDQKMLGLSGGKPWTQPCHWVLPWIQVNATKRSITHTLYSFVKMLYYLYRNSEACQTWFIGCYSPELKYCIITYSFSPVDWGSRIHRLPEYVGLYNTLTASQQTPKTYVLDMTRKSQWGYCNARALGNADYSFIAITPMSTLIRSGRTW